MKHFWKKCTFEQNLIVKQEEKRSKVGKIKSNKQKIERGEA